MLPISQDFAAQEGMLVKNRQAKKGKAKQLALQG